MGRTVGIDIGTTTSCIAVLEDSRAIVMHTESGDRTIPSLVSWNEDGEVAVGRDSRREWFSNFDATVFGVKQLLGRKASDPYVQELARQWPYAVVAATNGDAWIDVAGARRSPNEIAAHLLANIKRVAEHYLDDTVVEAVVAVPASFDDVQRQAITDACAIAGLTLRALLDEPTAAALAYGVHRQHDQRIAVLDLGGGTLDVSIVWIEHGASKVLATRSDPSLGGDAFDRAIVGMLADDFMAEHGVDLRRVTGQDPRPVPTPVWLQQQLKACAERAKIQLSSATMANVTMPFIVNVEQGPLHLERELDRGQLEHACKALLDRLESPCLAALVAARCTPSDLDHVLLVGGMARMPAIQERAAAVFGRPVRTGANSDHTGGNPDEIVALGAAVHSGILRG
ncbi:MAG: Hsp70 family protein [Myxococcales bacterium]|nr:Hsp70 family protein [Myxococcales bacterium]